MFTIPFTIALREIRHGLKGFGVFLVCLVLGVAMIATIGTVSTAINEAIHRESRSLLGGDIEILNNQEPLSQKVQSFIKNYGDVSLSVEMRAMGRAASSVSLVELKAVDTAYPLVGAMVLEPAIPLNEALRGNGVVMEQASLDRMGMKLGDTITLGSKEFTLRAVVVKEPDRVVNTFSFGPRVMVGTAALQETGLLLPGSLVKYRYRLLLHGNGDYKNFQKVLKKTFPGNAWQVRNLTQAAASIEEVIEHFHVFMTLTALSALLIGGIGISGAVSRYLESKAHTIATLKSLGASRQIIFTTYLLLILMIGAIGIGLGCGLGWGMAVFSLPYLGKFMPVEIVFALYPAPLLLAAVFGLLTIFTFSTYALGRAMDVRPALLFRGGLAPLSKVRWQLIAVNYAIVVMFVVVTVWTSPDRFMALLFIQIAIACVCAFWGFGQMVMGGAKRIRPRRPWLRLAVANIHRPGATTVPTMLAIGVGLTVLITLLVVEGNFRKRIGETIPEIAPSLFMIDIQPEQEGTFLKTLAGFENVSDVTTTMMLRARVVKIKETPVAKAEIEESAQWVTRGDRGITAMGSPLKHIKVVEGKWWRADYHGKPLLSLDSRVAEGMHVKIGDTLTLDVGGREITAEIVNLRQVDYSTLQINFAMVLSPGVVDDLPHTFIATAHVKDTAGEAAVIRQLAEVFPNISVVQVSGVLAQLKEMMDYVSLALKAMISLALVTGVLVLAGALAATQEKRAYDTVILKVLGARRKDIIKSYMAEWFILSCITSVIAIGLGELFAWEILKRFRPTEFFFLPWVVAVTLFVTFMVVTVLGFMGNMRAFQVKPVAVLRNE